MSDDLPAPALQKRMAGAGNKMKGMMSNFGAATASNTDHASAGVDSVNFTPLNAINFGPDDDGSVAVSIDGDAAQRFATTAAAGAANSYLQGRTYGMFALTGGDNGAGGLTIGGMNPSDLGNFNAEEMQKVAGGAADNMLKARTGGMMSFEPNAVGGLASGLSIGGTAASDLVADPSRASAAASGAANNFLQNRTGGLVRADNEGGLAIGGNAAGALTKGMDPFTGAIAAGAAGIALQQQTGGILGLNSAGNLTIKSNEQVDRRMQEARAAAAVAGTSLSNGFASGASALGMGGGTNNGTAAVNIDGSAPREGGQQAFGGGAVFDVARGEFQARWSRMVAEEERLRAQSMDIDRRERQLAMKTSRQAPNFPPVKLCCIKPVVHHDIHGCIPLERQTFVKACYGTFYGTILMLIANLVMIIVNVASCGKEKLAGSNAAAFNQQLVLPVVYLLFGSIGAFFVWYHPTYSACGTGTSITYVMAFIGIFVGFAFSVFMAVGPEGYGGAGFLYAILSTDRCGSSNMLMIIPVAALWAGLSVCMFAYGIHLRKYYVEDQASLEQARDQLKSQMR